MSAEAPSAPQHSIENLVFVGNLPFRADDQELRDFFAPAGTVTDVNVIKRGTRSLGYGFVQFSEAAGAEKAVALCHKKELNGREINVELAKPKSELPPRPPRTPRKKAPRKKKAAGDSEPKQQETEDGVVVSHGEKKKRKPRARKAKEGEGEEGAAEKAAPKERKPKRAPRERRPPPTGEPSKTTVFVSNLPFSLNNETLGATFAAYKVKSSTVIVRKVTGRSKGFGFVELADEAEQARLLKDVADGLKFTVEERDLGVKVALSDQKEDGAAAEPATASA
jgi:RNA recognition motif-containing protein